MDIDKLLVKIDSLKKLQDKLECIETIMNNK